MRGVDHLRHRVGQLELSAHPMRPNPLTLSALAEEIFPTFEVEGTFRRPNILTVIYRRRAVDEHNHPFDLTGNLRGM